MKIHAVLAALLLHFSLPALAQPDEAGKLIAAGTVPDEAPRMRLGHHPDSSLLSLLSVGR